MRDAIRWLLLLRHAKADPEQADQSDRERPLAARGRRVAQQMGAYLAASGREPRLVLCSPARRALETLESLRESLPRRARVEIEDDLYLASCLVLRERVSAISDDDSSVLVIGHNPGIQEFALALAVEGDAAQRRRLALSFPAGACAIFRSRAPHWSGVPANCRLEEFARPEDLPD